MPILKRLGITFPVLSTSTLPPFMGMIFFWAIFDGILIYVSPIVFSQAGLSNSELGLVLGSSSLFGALFDLILTKVVKNPSFRRFYLFLFVVGAGVPLVLWQGKTIPFFLLVMAMWGIYFDLINFGNFDFVSRHFAPEKTTFAFSLIMVFKSMGYIVAPIIAGLAIVGVIDPSIFILMWVFLGISFLFFVSLAAATRRNQPLFPNHPESDTQDKSIREEFRVWRRLVRVMWSPLLFTILFGIYDAFFYTIGPLLANSYTDIHPYNGLIIAAYWIPTFLVSMYTSKLTERFGKKRTAYVGLILAAAPLCLFFLAQDPFTLIVLIFISAIFSSFSVPAINAAYADYIREAQVYEEEITSTTDFVTNFGYIVGPILAGVLADQYGFLVSFSLLGIALLLVLALLTKFGAKNVDVAAALG